MSPNRDGWRSAACPARYPIPQDSLLTQRAIHIIDRETVGGRSLARKCSGQRLDQPRALQDGVLMLVFDGVGQERSNIRQVVADASRDSGQMRQQRPPPVIGAEDDGCSVADAAQMRAD